MTVKRPVVNFSRVRLILVGTKAPTCRDLRTAVRPWWGAGSPVRTRRCQIVTSIPAVPYDELLDLDEANQQFEQADAALVIAANDLTNPAARRPGSPIAGMPILDVDHAKSVVVIKRSMGHGYAGIDNELYTNPNTRMYFGDAKQALSAIMNAIKTLVG